MNQAAIPQECRSRRKRLPSHLTDSGGTVCGVQIIASVRCTRSQEASSIQPPDSLGLEEFETRIWIHIGIEAPQLK